MRAGSQPRALYPSKSAQRLNLTKESGGVVRSGGGDWEGCGRGGREG